MRCSTLDTALPCVDVKLSQRLNTQKYKLKNTALKVLFDLMLVSFQPQPLDQPGALITQE